MTHPELFKLHELKGRLKGRILCLESDIHYSQQLTERLESLDYKARFAGRVDILTLWIQDTNRILEEVERIIKEAENAEEQDDLPF